jgi:hypothetical protein
LGHGDGLFAREHPRKPAPFPEDEGGKTGNEHANTADTQENFFLVQVDPLEVKNPCNDSLLTANGKISPPWKDSNFCACAVTPSIVPET